MNTVNKYTTDNMKALAEFVIKNPANCAEGDKLIQLSTDILVLKNALDNIYRELAGKYNIIKELAEHIYKDSAQSTFINICDALGVSTEFVLRDTREIDVINYRMVVSYLMVEVYGFTLIKTGKLLNKDHSSIIHSRKRVYELLEIKDRDIITIINKFYESDYYKNTVLEAVKVIDSVDLTIPLHDNFINICEALEFKYYNLATNEKQIVCYLLYYCYKYSIAKIAKYVGKDRSTVRTSINKVSDFVEINDVYTNSILEKFYTSDFYTKKL